MTGTRHSDAATRVLQFAHARPGVIFSTAEAVSTTGLPASTVSGALSRFTDDPATGIRAAGPRGAYLFTGRVRGKVLHERKPLPVGTLMEVIGQTPDGLPIVKDEEGIGYVAKPVQ